MWSHQQPHLYENVSLLESDMILNKNFAIVSLSIDDIGKRKSILNIITYLGARDSYQLWLLGISSSLWSVSSSRSSLRHVEKVVEYPGNFHRRVSALETRQTPQRIHS